MSNSNFLWEIILKELKAELPAQVFETWFLGASIDKVDFANKIIVITSKEALVSQFIHGAYDARLKQILLVLILILSMIHLIIILKYLKNQLKQHLLLKILLDRTSYKVINLLELNTFIKNKVYL